MRREPLEMKARRLLAPLVIATALIGAGCEKGPPPPPPGAEDCAPLRALGKRSLDRWKDVGAKGPKPDAPLSAGADHAEALAKTAREIAADFAKLGGARREVSEAKEGVRMLGELASQKLDALAKTVRALDGALSPMEKQESAANDAVEKLGKDIAANLGCGAAGPTECAAVTAKVAELDSQRAPHGLAQAAQIAGARADTLEGLARAVEALPPAPPKQKAREEAAANARTGAAAFRALAKSLGQAAAPQERLDLDREEAAAAAARFAGELQAAMEACGGAPAPKGSAAGPAGSAAAPKGSAR